MNQIELLQIKTITIKIWNLKGQDQKRIDKVEETISKLNYKA